MRRANIAIKGEVRIVAVEEENQKKKQYTLYASLRSLRLLSSLAAHPHSHFYALALPHLYILSDL